jgi:H+/Cl- antiporter ClcA
MGEHEKGRRPFSLNQYERKILNIVFLAAGIPVFLVIGFFYCMFSDLVYTYLNTGLAGHFLDQFLVLSLILILYYFLFVAIVAYSFAHRLVGALPRVIRELDQKIAGKSKSHIQVRKDDYVKELIDRINMLIDKFF